jgi:hypothetical protein
MSMSLHSSKEQEDVCAESTCFRGMLQVFRISVAKVNWDITKVDRDVAHTTMAMHVCFKCMS